MGPKKKKKGIKDPVINNQVDQAINKRKTQKQRRKINKKNGYFGFLRFLGEV